MLDSQKRIAGAFLVGAVLVAGAFYISRRSDAINSQSGIQAITTEERQYIPITDTDEDGVPDWQDSLLSTGDITIPTGTSTYEKPTTLTGSFGVDFFKDYMLAKTYGAFGDTPEELAANASQKLAKKAIDELFTEKDITTFPLNDAQTLHDYGNHVASILLAHPNDGDSEAIILQDYMNYRKPERLADLDPIELAYISMVKDMLEAPVPQQYTKQHLDLTNALNAIREDVRAMRNVDEDALYTLLRMKRYEDDVLGLSNALKNLFNTLYLQDNIRWTQGEDVSKLFTFTEPS